MSDGFGNELDRLGARVHRCERRASDPAGDPAMFRFREAVAAGAIPFTVQGPENALALDGGRTLGWEIGEQLAEQGGVELDRIFVQVGGGAFAACVGATHPARQVSWRCKPPVVRRSLAHGTARAAMSTGIGTRGAWVGGVDDAVGEPPLARRRDPRRRDLRLARRDRRDRRASWGGPPVVAEEADIVAAHQLARAAGFDVSPTGSAGLAGLLAVIEAVQPTERVAVVMSGVAR
jgi:threonine synthase